jgi:hypothetical protein
LTTTYNVGNPVQPQPAQANNASTTTATPTSSPAVPANNSSSSSSSTAGTVYNPLQPDYQSAPPTLAATTSNYNVSPSQSISDLQNADALQDAQANNNLSNLLASEGITGNDALAAQGAESGQLAASQDPAMASIIQNAQGLGLGQSEFNAGASNTAGALNLSSLMGVNSANQNAANNANSEEANMLEGNYGTDLSAFTNILNGGLSGAQNINSQNVSGNLSNVGAEGQQQNSNTQGNESNFLSALAMFA